MKIQLAKQDIEIEQQKASLIALYRSLKAKRRAIELLVFEGLDAEALLIGQRMLHDAAKVFCACRGVEEPLETANVRTALNKCQLNCAREIEELLYALNHEKEFAILVRKQKTFLALFRELNILLKQRLKFELVSSLDILKRRRRKRFFSVAIVSCLLILGFLPIVYLYGQRAKEQARQELLASARGTRIRDLIKLRDAIYSYKKAHGVFPKSDSFDGLHSCWGRSAEDWIRGLVPQFIDKLPRDPRANDQCNQQYLYASNGNDFKLLAHGVEDCEYIRKFFPEMIDPGRQCGSSASYGFWTSGFKGL